VGSVVVTEGPAYGYYANPGKTKLVVKTHSLEDAKQIFTGSGINITDEGSRDLGEKLGVQIFCRDMWTTKLPLG
jgi:hypothetical protein